MTTAVLRGWAISVVTGFVSLGIYAYFNGYISAWVSIALILSWLFLSAFQSVYSYLDGVDDCYDFTLKLRKKSTEEKTP